VCAVTEQTRSSIAIEAPPSSVMRVIADFPNYPAWVSFLKQVEVLETDASGRGIKVRFVLDAGVVAEDYDLAYIWSDDGVSWQLTRGTSIKALDGSYHLVATETGTDVGYALSIVVDIPLLGVFKRKAEQVLIDTALRALKARVEA
jgi:ribosome-associated toxin RatA of RatAB toxin-antitoxin module